MRQSSSSSSSSAAAAASSRNSSEAAASSSSAHLHDSTDGSTPLHKAAASGNAEGVQLLVDAGEDVHALDNKGLTPLDVARQSSRSDSFGGGSGIFAASTKHCDQRTA